MRTSPLMRFKPLWIMLAAALSASPAVATAQQAEQQFKEGYFQQTHQQDYAAAAAAYEKVVADSAAPEALRAEAKTRLAQTREDQAATDLAQLMPPNSILYFEISRPGKHVGRLLEMLGLQPQPDAKSPSDAKTATPLPGGLALPADFKVSPALVRELQKVRGAAVAITGVEPDGRPHGVAVIHPGDFDLTRGLIETGLQVLPEAEPIAGFKVYQVQGEVWVAATNRLFIVADSREQVAQTVSRLQDKKADSLAQQPHFSRLKEGRENSLAFVYVNGQRALQAAGPHLRGQEAMMVRMFLDLEHLESVSAGFGTTEKGIQAHARVVLAEGHRNLAYGMVRTAPMSRRSLAHVPAGAVAVAVFGLNPPDQSGGQPGGQAPSLSAMDIGREVFSNVEEVSLFVLPPERGDAGPPIPEFGMIAAVKDPAKSEALWDQLLSLAAMFGPQVAEPPKEIEIEGRKAKQYQFRGAPPIVVVRLADRAMAAGTEDAISAAIRAEGPYAITGDPQFKLLLDGLKAESSKAVLVHVGRAIGVAASMPRAPEEAKQIAALMGDLKVMVVTNEQPNEFVIRASATGLPNVPKIVQATLQAHPLQGERSRRTSAVRVRVSEPQRPEERPQTTRRIEETTPAPDKP
jgi:hypothetical protein